MTNKEIKKLVENLEHTLVSMQNDRNRDSFNLKLKSDRLEMLEAQLEVKESLLLNRNKQVQELSDKIQTLEKQVKRRDSFIIDKNESVDNLEFLLDKKNEEIEELKDKVQTRSERVSELLGYIEELENKLIKETKKK